MATAGTRGASVGARKPLRVDGYAPVRDYALVGDGRVAALVALDGAIDWLCLPEFDSPSVFAAVLDAERGGRFALAPTAPFEAERRYLGGGNVLQTTFHTEEGVVRVTDGLALDDGELLPWRELTRRVECLSGTVEVAWTVEPRFGFAQEPVSVERREGTPVARCGAEALAVLAFDLGEPQISSDTIAGRATLGDGDAALLTLVHVAGDPLPLLGREELERRLDLTARYWGRYAETIAYEGRWREAVRRSLLALRLLTYQPTGALAAAATCSLPEVIGGSRNFDYRYAWVRDTALALQALLGARLTADAHRAFVSLLEAASHTHPRLQPIYTLSGRPRVPSETVPLAGYRGSAPVNVGNSAEGQLQLGDFAHFVLAAWHYAGAGHALDAGTGARVADVANLICEVWRNDDSGIWEIENRPYTYSKMACWAALERAIELAEHGPVPRESLHRWRVERDQIRSYVDERCWSPTRRAYAFYADGDDLDASILLAGRLGYLDPTGERMRSTIEAIRGELARGPLLYRYSGMQTQENCFLACSFWLVDALARAGDREEAAALMDELVELANDVGLLSEQMEPSSHELLGNFPQTITHLAVVNAAVTLEETGRDGAAERPAR